MKINKLNIKDGIPGVPLTPLSGAAPIAVTSKKAKSDTKKVKMNSVGGKKSKKPGY